MSKKQQDQSEAEWLELCEKVRLLGHNCDNKTSRKMKTHLKAFLLTVGFIASVALVGFVVYTWKWIGIAAVLTFAFAFVYAVAYSCVKEHEHRKRTDEAKRAVWEKYQEESLWEKYHGNDENTKK